MSIRPDEISAILKTQIKNFDTKLEASEVGMVIEVGDGIARVHGLQNTMVNELLEFPVGLRVWHKTLRKTILVVSSLGSIFISKKVTLSNVQGVLLRYLLAMP